MTDDEQRKSDEKKSKHRRHIQKVYAAVNLDRCQEEWTVAGVFMCKCDATEFCIAEMRNAARCNNPLEWWRVAEYRLDCGEICWGPHQVSTGVCL